MPANISNIEAFDSSKQLTTQNSSWWSRRTKLEKKLSVVAVFCLVLFCVMVLVFSICGYRYLNYTDNSDNAVACLTPDCVKLASEILLNLDEKVDPCTDFYQFACGGWLNRHIIPEDKSYIDVAEEINDEFFIIIKDLLEKELKDSDPPYDKMIKDLYNSCMDLNAIEEAGAEPLKEVLSTFGGWPVVAGKKWKEDKFDWLECLIHIRKLGYNHNIIFRLSVEVDERRNTFHIITLERPILSLPDRAYWIELGLNDTTTAAYYKKMIQAAKYLGADAATAENELLEALHFEMTLANYSALSDEDEGNVTRSDNKYSIKELQDMIPQIPWLKYFNSLLTDEIYENEILATSALGFLKNFADLIIKTEKRDRRNREKFLGEKEVWKRIFWQLVYCFILFHGLHKRIHMPFSLLPKIGEREFQLRVVANYMLWRVVEESLPFLSKKLTDMEFEYNKVKMGDKKEKPRYIQCLLNTFIQLSEVTPKKIDIGLSSYYLRHYLDERRKDVVLEIAKYVREEFLNILDGIPWMDEITKAHAKLKAKNIKILVGYPKELLNDTAVTEFFKTLSITSDSYYGDIFEIKKWATDYEFSQLRKPHVRGDWRNYAALGIGCFMESNENMIQILPGILQKPYFYRNSPYYMNFGAIGLVIGHEITHGFDDGGKDYDKDGNLSYWWEPTSDEQFEQKAQCIIEQYNNYTTEIGMQVDGEITESENIADNGGLKEAYLAYLSWVEENGPEKLLPGLKYNQKQLFWISSADLYCAKLRPEKIKDFLLNDGHSLYKFRVIGPMSNLEAFAKDFNCPLNSPMNKQPKCQVW